MADENGKDNTQQRLDALEQMDKLLLRAQVLQQDALEQLEKTVKQHAKWQRAAGERDKRLYERIDKLVVIDRRSDLPDSAQGLR